MKVQYSSSTSSTCHRRNCIPSPGSSTRNRGSSTRSHTNNSYSARTTKTLGQVSNGTASGEFGALEGIPTFTRPGRCLVGRISIWEVGIVPLVRARTGVCSIRRLDVVLGAIHADSPTQTCPDATGLAICEGAGKGLEEDDGRCQADSRPQHAHVEEFRRSSQRWLSSQKEVLNTSRQQEEGRCSVTSDGDEDGGEKERKTKGREDKRMNDSAQPNWSGGQ